MRIGVIVPVSVQDDTAQLPTWSQIRRFAEHAESVGVHSLWVFDHLYSGHGDVAPTAVHEAWTIQTALAAVTSKVELGQLVTCVSFRDPGVMAKMATTVDEISGSRLTLGLGAGWYDREYRDFGFPTDHRGRRFSEALSIILPLLHGETVTVEGRFHRVDNATLLPAPSRRIPVLIAGKGPRMRQLVAEHADAWNTAWYETPDATLEARMAQMRSSLDDAGRDHASLRWTVGMTPADTTDAAAYADAIEQFAATGIDDLIVSLPSASPASLDQLAAAATRWLTPVVRT